MKIERQFTVDGQTYILALATKTGVGHSRVTDRLVAVAAALDETTDVLRTVLGPNGGVRDGE